MSQVLSAMRRQLPAAQALLAELGALRQGNVEANDLTNRMGLATSGADLRDLEANLNQFVRAMACSDSWTAVRLWVRLAPVLKRSAP